VAAIHGSTTTPAPWYKVFNKLFLTLCIWQELFALLLCTSIFVATLVSWGMVLLNWCSLNFAHLIVGNKVTGQANYICLQISIVTSSHTSIGIKNWRPKLFVLF
jgi:hypothetical protein